MDELAAALAAIDKLARDPKAQMFGLSTPLRSLGATLTRQHEDNQTLARAILKLHYWPGESLKPDMFERVVKIAGSP